MENNLVKSTTPVYTLTVASALSGIQPHSIRQYIDRGLIIPFKKDSKRNLFSVLDIKWLKYIHKLLVEDGLNIAGIKALFSIISCWELCGCSKEVREECQAFISDNLPCWEAANKDINCKNKECRECEVYKIIEHHPDLKSFIKSRAK